MPAYAYGVPTAERAAATAAEAPADGVPGAAGSPSVCEVGSPSAPSVCGPAMPSTSSPREAWNARTAARVIGPYSPSAATPSARCSAAVTLAAAAVQRAARDRADHAVDLEAAGALEGEHGLVGLRAEHAVGGDAERALRRGDRRAAAAHLQVAADGARARGLLRGGQLGGGRDDRRREHRGRDGADVEAGPPRGRLPAPQRPFERPLPQLERAEVAAAGRLRPDRPAVVEAGGWTVIRAHPSTQAGRNVNTPLPRCRS